MKILLYLLLVLPLTCITHAQTPAWEWSEKATFLGTQDPMHIVLNGDREIEVIYSALRHEDVEAWPIGKSLLLGYAAKTGAVLIEPDTGKFLPIISGLKQHPIDTIIRRCIATEGPRSGMDIPQCYEKGYVLWDAEMNVWYSRLMAAKDGSDFTKNGRLLDDADQHLLQQSQVQWMHFRDLQLKAIAAIYGHIDGALWAQVAQRKKIELPKQQALQLASYFEFL
jgi:uncharacterized protein YecT (DUF1311 family)